METGVIADDVPSRIFETVMKLMTLINGIIFVVVHLKFLKNKLFS
jgi:hypothetical protein